MPFETVWRQHGYGDSEFRIKAETYHQMDICAAPLPFPDEAQVQGVAFRLVGDLLAAEGSVGIWDLRLRRHFGQRARCKNALTMHVQYEYAPCRVPSGNRRDRLVGC